MSDAPRYWLSVGDGQSYGPYTIEELNTYAADGRVTASSMLCVDGTTEWVAAPTVIGSFARASGVPPMHYGSAYPNGAPAVARRVGMVWPVVATVGSVLFCCLPIGLGAVVYANIANAKYAVGDDVGGQRAESSSTAWLWTTIILGGISAVFSVWSLYAVLDMLSNLQL